MQWTPGELTIFLNWSTAFYSVFHLLPDPAHQGASKAPSCPGSSHISWGFWAPSKYPFSKSHLYVGQIKSSVLGLLLCLDLFSKRTSATLRIDFLCLEKLLKPHVQLRSSLWVSDLNVHKAVTLWQSVGWFSKPSPLIPGLIVRLDFPASLKLGLVMWIMLANGKQNKVMGGTSRARP